MNRRIHPATARTRRSRVLWLRGFEDRAPGPVAYVVHRSRRTTRDTSRAGLDALQRWARDAAERLRSTDDSGTPDAERGEITEEQLARVPDDGWTKGEIYELAKAFDIEGRSKLDKQQLLEAVLKRLDEMPAPGDENDVDDELVDARGEEAATSGAA